jgi:hypothetical protein
MRHNWTGGVRVGERKLARARLIAAIAIRPMAPSKIGSEAIRTRHGEAPTVPDID